MLLAYVVTKHTQISSMFAHISKRPKEKQSHIKLNYFNTQNYVTSKLVEEAASTRLLVLLFLTGQLNFWLSQQSKQEDEDEEEKKLENKSGA